MNRLWAIAGCVLMLASTSATAEIYKWKDRSGKTQYSDMPPMSNIPYTTLSGRKPAGTPPPAAPAPNAQPPQNVPAQVGTAPKEGPPPKGEPVNGDPNSSLNKVPEELKEKAAEDKRREEERLVAENKAKEQACKDARARVAQFQQGGRIYKVNERGEREYYGDQEIAAELENAKADVAANCE